jgi:MoxR-like ATPase
MERVTIQGVEITLTTADDFRPEWVDYGDYARLLQAAWLRLSEGEPPLNPRLIGEPGLGKTTLACEVARRLGRELYFFQCTMDTRPEDLLITPVLTGERRIEYRASPVVTAMLRGGVLVLDEGNRMPERSWASLAPLLDERRYVESTIAGVKLHAHREFRVCVTMNDDASVYELPGYIQSRLKPRIEILPPPWEIREEIVRTKCPGISPELLRRELEKVREDLEVGDGPSTRDVITLAGYVEKLRRTGVEKPLGRALEQVLVAGA